MLDAGAPLSAWLTWLESLHPDEIDLGLERVRDVLGRLTLEQPDHVLLIAGTNGKGSSVAMTDALLRAAGMRDVEPRAVGAALGEAATTVVVMTRGAR